MPRFRCNLPPQYRSECAAQQADTRSPYLITYANGETTAAEHAGDVILLDTLLGDSITLTDVLQVPRIGDEHVNLMSVSRVAGAGAGAADVTLGRDFATISDDSSGLMVVAAREPSGLYTLRGWSPLPAESTAAAALHVKIKQTRHSGTIVLATLATTT